MGSLRVFYIETDVLTPEVTQQIFSMIHRNAPPAAAALPALPPLDDSSGNEDIGATDAPAPADVAPAPRPAPPRSRQGKKGQRYLTIAEKPELGIITCEAAAELLGVSRGSVRQGLSPSYQKKSGRVGGYTVRPAEPPAAAPSTPEREALPSDPQEAARALRRAAGLPAKSSNATIAATSLESARSATSRA